MSPGGREAVGRFVDRFCVACHEGEDKAAGLDLGALAREDVGRHPDAWEKVVRRLATRQMPPDDAVRPSRRDYDATVATLAGTLDRRAAEHPEPGRTGTFRRLNRTEYQGAIRDLLAVDVDASTLLPPDESSHGFDNVTVGDLSPTLLDRYITAAQRDRPPGRGDPPPIARGGDTFRDPGGRHPGGARRGAADRHARRHSDLLHLPARRRIRESRLRLARDRNEHVEGLREPHEDGSPPGSGAKWRCSPSRRPRPERENQTADEHLKVTGPGDGRPAPGRRDVPEEALLAPGDQASAVPGPLQHAPAPPDIAGAVSRSRSPGPYEAKAHDGHGDSPSRRRTLRRASREIPRTRRTPAPASILSTLIARRAYRRPVTEADLRKADGVLSARPGRRGTSTPGIEMALSAVLVNPNFLFRIEPDPPGVAPGSAYRLPDLQLASRLSFFVWSSIPDDELLGLADPGRAEQARASSKRQVRRMLADPRSSSLVSNFAGQWLHLRNLESITPGPPAVPRLRRQPPAIVPSRRRSVLFEERPPRGPRASLDLLKSDHTYLNESDWPGITGSRTCMGSHFRRVPSGPRRASMRGGLLRQGSVLMVTSYATRTSPVIRGKWILENILGTPPPPPPAKVPPLEGQHGLLGGSRSASGWPSIGGTSPAPGCHKLMDPAGFALENFDAVGRWRSIEEGRPIDSTGGLPDGSELRRGHRPRAEPPETARSCSSATLTEKLLTFATGSGCRAFRRPGGPQDRPRRPGSSDYRFSSLIAGIASSTPFQMRKSE